MTMYYCWHFCLNKQKCHSLALLLLCKKTSRHKMVALSSKKYTSCTEYHLNFPKSEVNITVKHNLSLFADLRTMQCQI